MAGKHEYPIYIISKGRDDNPLTALNFEKAGLDYLIAVEPQEADQYIKALGKNRVLILPFSNKGLGSFPARNFCWDHSIKQGYSHHWMFDDNIINWRKFANRKRIVWPDINTALRYVEIFTNQKNIDICGFEEPNFVRRPPNNPFKVNCHVYSAMLIKNSLTYRWRLKYNEDIDLCLQVLHNGGKTASCVYYMADKVSTVDKMKGGNQDELYKGNAYEKKLLKAKMIERVWPQYCKTVIRYGRPHHLIDWKVFSKRNTTKNTIND